ncbi:hypothetical protein BOTBODRAFT_182311 [Botryobasidium botryosum FD-172 SS1]|uniref:Ubiquitin-like protease family profile domain-containing protein n=1 Tax=Botryobasidium botryosum (strain FD-172 SS1) TaxID=930990 RepID=A0A067LR47_BOTB1|nr:hypothetical protein BOTBODRAFT_182311 [Botryobasidium botryosum FD-172 SS1]
MYETLGSHAKGSDGENTCSSVPKESDLAEWWMEIKESERESGLEAGHVKATLGLRARPSPGPEDGASDSPIPSEIGLREWAGLSPETTPGQASTSGSPTGGVEARQPVRDPSLRPRSLADHRTGHSTRSGAPQRGLARRSRRSGRQHVVDGQDSNASNSSAREDGSGSAPETALLRSFFELTVLQKDLAGTSSGPEGGSSVSEYQPSEADRHERDVWGINAEEDGRQEREGSTASEPEGGRPQEAAEWEQRASRYLSAPALWANAWNEIGTIASGEWVALPVINFFLLDQYFVRGTGEGASHVRYVESRMAGAWEGAQARPGLLEAYIFPRYRRNFSLPSPEHPCPPVPLLFVVYHENHFFVVIMDHENRCVHVIGRSGVDNILDPWLEWKGPSYYEHLCRLHGWEPGDIHNVTPFAVQGRINGRDCGSRAIAAALYLMDNGLEYDDEMRLKRPPTVCDHSVRLLVLERMHTTCWTSFQSYLFTREECPEEWFAAVYGEDPNTVTWPMDEVECSIKARVVGDANPLVAGLLREEHACRVCRWKRAAERETQGPLPEAPSPTPDGSRAHEDSESLTGEDPPAMTAGGEPGAARPGRLDRIRASNTSDLNSERFPRAIPPIDLALPEAPLQLAHCNKFDDYYHTPVMADFHDFVHQRERGRGEQILTTDTMEVHSRRSIWAIWRDYGYRIQPHFMQSFWLGEPQEACSHILTPGDTGGLPLAEAEDLPPARHRARHSRTGDGEAAPDDMAVLGLGEMLAQAGASGTKSAHDMFVRGRDKDGRFVVVDVLKDHVPLPRTSIRYSVDVDSIIYVTHRLHTKLGIDIMGGPSVGPPPLAKHNHMYVSILQPPKVAPEGGWAERPWDEVRMSISALPNARFGKVTEGRGQVVVQIVCPRLHHTNPYSGRKETAIPYPVLTVLWDEVVRPAMMAHCSVGCRPYRDFTTAENSLRAATKTHRKGNPGRPSSYHVSAEELLRIQDSMRETLARDAEGPRRLTMFGSFFFVLESKGIKDRSSVELGDGTLDGDAAWTRLVDNHPHLDFEHMLDRRHGEFVVDVGVGIHPAPGPNEAEVVGMWYLPKLEASFGAAGFQLGKLHSTNTLSTCGGIQAEGKMERSRRTHVGFRSSYNLQYELVRNAENQPVFASNKDAYQLSPAYMDDCRRRVALLMGAAQRRSYGARDEYRMSGRAGQNFLQNCREMVARYMDSDPIVWVPASVLHSWKAMRTLELQHTQVRICKLVPPNLAFLTGLVHYLQEAVDSTPIPAHAHVRDAMKLTRCMEIKAIFGMIFLQDLDLEETVPLGDLCERDTAEMLKAIGFSAGKPPTRRRKAQVVVDETSLAEYPLGARPTWAQVCEHMTRPWSIMREWVYTAPLSHSLVAGKLFVAFTRQIWVLLNDRWLTSHGYPEPCTLQDAMAVWEVKAVFNHLLDVVFLPSKAGLEGAGPGHPEETFMQRVDTFFPQPDAVRPQKRSQWGPLWHSGYISDYHAALAACRDDEARGDLLRDLETYFSNIQCLPISHRPTANTHGCVWDRDIRGIKLVTNPCYYKLHALGSTRTAPRRRQPPATKKHKDAVYAIMAATGQGAAMAKEVLRDERKSQKQQRNRRSGAVLNKRAPPKRKPAPMQAPRAREWEFPSSSDTDGEEEEDELDGLDDKDRDDSTGSQLEDEGD